MAHMPDIKPDVNKEKDKDKKKAGLFARMFGGSSSGGALATGGYGGAASGGLMATKAGLLALILAGSTVAGGIGLVGYRLFGPGQDAGSGDNNNSLFASKPKEAPASDAAPKDGSSASLKMASQPVDAAGADQAAKDAAAAAAKDAADKAAATKDAEKAKADASAATAAAKSAQDHIADVAGGNGVSKGMLKAPAKFGNFSAGASSGGGMGGTATVGAGLNGNTASAAGKAGTMTAMAHGRAAQGGSSRAVASRRVGGAMSDLMGVRSDLKGAQTSYAAGRTYDNGTAAAGNNIGPDGGQIGMPGAGQGGSAAQPKSSPNTANQVKELQPPPTPTPKNEAPWQHAIQTAQVLLGVATLLLLVAKMISKTGTWGALAAQIIGGVVAVIGAVGIALGAQIAGGQYGQMLQGGLLAAAGAGLALAGAMAATSSTTTASDGSKSLDVFNDAKEGMKDGQFAGVNPFIMLGGGLAAVGLVGTMLVPPKQYPSTQFQNGQPPDTHWFGMRELPSEKALKKMIA